LWNGGAEDGCRNRHGVMAGEGGGHAVHLKHD
jgi:hypothetical protein